jgi:hypothetical protein
LSRLKEALGGFLLSYQVGTFGWVRSQLFFENKMPEFSSPKPQKALFCTKPRRFGHQPSKSANAFGL